MSMGNINMSGNTLRYYTGKGLLLEAAEMLWYNDSMQSGNGEKRPGVSSARGGLSPGGVLCEFKRYLSAKKSDIFLSWIRIFSMQTYLPLSRVGVGPEWCIQTSQRAEEAASGNFFLKELCINLVKLGTSGILPLWVCHLSMM